MMDGGPPAQALPSFVHPSRRDGKCERAPLDHGAVVVTVVVAPVAVIAAAIAAGVAAVVIVVATAATAAAIAVAAGTKIPQAYVEEMGNHLLFFY